MHHIIRALAPPQTLRGNLARRVRLTLLAALGGVPAPRAGGPGESRRLQASWSKHRAEMLDDYLVTGYQNPRVNAQSILTRHFLVRALFGSDFDPLMRKELEFGVSAHAAIREGAREAGIKVRPRADPAERARIKEVSAVNTEREEEFEYRWNEVLSARTADPISVLELACGSANDYRFFDSYGLARFLRYTGVDLNQSNIDNARARFPDVDFGVADMLRLPFGDDAFDYVIAFDIFEHLSLRSMERALSEAMRVARSGLALTFFVMADVPEHTERQLKKYHRNELSRPRIEELIRSRFPTVDAKHIKTLLIDEFQASGYYNKRAWTITAKRG